MSGGVALVMAVRVWILTCKESGDATCLLRWLSAVCSVGLQRFGTSMLLPFPCASVLGSVARLGACLSSFKFTFRSPQRVDSC